jgi:hypothetical protein
LGSEVLCPREVAVENRRGNRRQAEFFQATIQALD